MVGQGAFSGAGSVNWGLMRLGEGRTQGWPCSCPKDTVVGNGGHSFHFGRSDFLHPTHGCKGEPASQPRGLLGGNSDFDVVGLNSAICTFRIWEFTYSLKFYSNGKIDTCSDVTGIGGHAEWQNIYVTQHPHSQVRSQKLLTHIHSKFTECSLLRITRID